MARAIAAVVLILAFIGAIIFSDNIKGALRGFLDPNGSDFSVTIRQNNTDTPLLATVPAVTNQEANPEPQGGWVISYCEYRVGFVANMPSGKSVRAGDRVSGPALLVPLNGNVASWVGTKLIFEGESEVASVPSVSQEYASGTQCNLHKEVLNSPARIYFGGAG